MKILAFGDTHGSNKYLVELHKKIAIHNPDIIVCLGDITIFGSDINNILKKIDSFGKKTLIIHGNHEAHEDVGKESRSYKNLKFIHGKIHREGNVLFVGWGGGGFSHKDDKFYPMFEKTKAERKRDDVIVLVTHGPPYGTVIDKLAEGHCGNKTYMEFIKKFRPRLALSGHLHENHGKREKVGDTLIINPGPEGKILIL